MKKNFLSKVTALILSIMMIFSVCACDSTTPQQNEYPKNGVKKIITTTKDLYLPDGSSEKFNVAYYENEEEVLLVEIEHAITELLINFALAVTGASVTSKQTDTTFTITRDNGAYCEIDFVKDTIYFDDFDVFTMKGFASNPHDLLAMPYVNEDGQNEYLMRRASFFTPGYAIEIDLAERDIPLDIYNGKKYIPLQTFNDVFVSPHGVNVAYNGEKLFALAGNTISDEIASIYYGREKAQRSTALAEFTYNELCLYLDLYYGLKDAHGFNDGFDYYLESIGLKEELLKPDATNEYNALGTLTMGYISDLHSIVAGASPYVGAPRPSEGDDIEQSASFIDYVQANSTYKGVRADIMGEVNIYQKVGNTAYVTFDSFTLTRSGDYQQDLAQPLGDTIAIISAVHQAIIADEEIENVVLDLSCNGGGAVDAAIYTIAWMLGYCDFSICNSITNSKSTITYKADVNFDHEFDEADSISNKNLYCLISPVSFSCGNLVPALLKASGNVTIMGKTSTGGACVVSNAVTADGTIFNISSPGQLATVKNGTYYSIDIGVEPDVYLSNIESFYNRAELTAYINTLM